VAINNMHGRIRRLLCTLTIFGSIVTGAVLGTRPAFGTCRGGDPGGRFSSVWGVTTDCDCDSYGCEDTGPPAYVCQM